MPTSSTEAAPAPEEPPAEVPAAPVAARPRENAAAERCHSCGGVKAGPGACPWCGEGAEGRALTAEEAASLRARRRRLLRRGAIVAAAAVVLAGAAAGGAYALEHRRHDRDWKADRAAAGAKVAGTLRDLDLDPTEPEPLRLRGAERALDDLAADLVDDKGHARARRALAEHVSEVGAAIGTIADVADIAPGILTAAALTGPRAAWSGIVDDIDAISRATGAHVDLPATRARVDAFMDARLERARTEQQHRRVLAEKFRFSEHKTAVERIFSEYEALRAELDAAGISEVEASEYYTPFGVTEAIEEAADKRHALAESLRRLDGPTSSLDARLERMATFIKEMAGLLDGLDDLTGTCRLTASYDYVCPRIGELPSYKRFLSETNAAYQRLVVEKNAWAAEIDAEVARLDKELPQA